VIGRIQALVHLLKLCALVFSYDGRHAQHQPRVGVRAHSLDHLGARDTAVLVPNYPIEQVCHERVRCSSNLRIECRRA
jgi:hypothetical protein